MRRYLRNSLIALSILWLTVPEASAQFYRPEKPDAFMRDNSKIKSLLRPLVAEAAKSVVKIFSDNKEVALGTIVDSDGWIITKASELRSENLKVKFKDGREFEPKLVGVEDRNDLALLKIDTRGLKPVEFRNSKTLKLGQFLVSAGVDPDPIAIGVVGVLTRSNLKIGDYPVANRSRTSGWLGVGLGDGKGGALVSSVAKDGAASKAGLKLNDVVINIAGKKVTDSETMIFLLLRYRVGEEVPVRVKRGEEEIDVVCTLGKRPADFQSMGLDRGQFQNGIHKDLSDVNVGFPTALQHDSVLKAREVGGPVIDLDGKMVGMNIASSGRVDSYSIPAEVIEGLLPELKSGKLAPQKLEVKKTSVPAPTKE